MDFLTRVVKENKVKTDTIFLGKIKKSELKLGSKLNQLKNLSDLLQKDL